MMIWGSRGSRGAGDGLGELAHASAHVGPNTSGPVGLSHDVMEEDIAAPRG